MFEKQNLHFFDSKPGLSITGPQRFNYISLTGGETLHVKLLNRQNANDGLCVMHGPRKTLDDHSRTLRLGTAAESSSDRGDASAQSSKYVGVSYRKKNGKHT
jgi:hypothetical protein